MKHIYMNSKYEDINAALLSKLEVCNKLAFEETRGISFSRQKEKKKRYIFLPSPSQNPLIYL